MTCKVDQKKRFPIRDQETIRRHETHRSNSTLLQGIVDYDFFDHLAVASDDFETHRRIATVRDENEVVRKIG